MATHLDYKYPLDITGESLVNFVPGERHTVEPKEARLIVFRSGPFFTRSARVYDWVTGKDLVLGVDYEFLCLYEEASLACSAEIATVIELKNPLIKYDIGVDANVVGGEFSYSDAVIIKLLAQVVEDNRNVMWDSIKGMPLLFTPSPHMHLADTDLTGTGTLTKGLERIEEAIILRNVESITGPLLSQIHNKLDKDSSSKVGLEDAIWTPAKLTSKGFQVSMPKSVIGNVEFLMEVIIKGPDTVDEFVISATEQGSHYRDVVISRKSNGNLKWGVKLSSLYTLQNTVEFSSEMFDTPRTGDLFTFFVKGYYVNTPNPRDMTGTPTFLEFDSLVSELTPSDIIWPDTDERDFVATDRNVLLSGTRDFTTIDSGSALSTSTGKPNSLFGFKFPDVLDNVTFDFHLEIEVNLTLNSVDTKPITYFINGKYSNASKYSITNVQCSGSPAYPLHFWCSEGETLSYANPIIVTTPESAGSIRGYVNLRSLTVTNSDKATWLQDWGLFNEEAAMDGVGYKSRLINPKIAKSRDVNQEAAFNKVVFSNGRYRGTLPTVQTNGIKLKLPKLVNLVSEPERLAVELTVTYDDGTTLSIDKYLVSWSSQAGSLQAWWVGTTDNRFRFFIGSTGALEMKTDALFKHCTIHVDGIFISTNKPHRVSSYLEWALRDSTDAANDQYMVTASENELPEFKNWVESSLSSLGDELTTNIDTRVKRSGDKMLGSLELFGNATTDLQAVPKRQLDSNVNTLNSAINTKVNKQNGVFTSAPTSNVKATNNTHLIRKGESDASVKSATDPLVRRAGDTMLGNLALVGNATSAKHAVPKQQLDASVNTINTSISKKVDKVNGVFSNAPTSQAAATSGTHLMRKVEADKAIAAAANQRILRSGDTMSGFLSLVGNATSARHAVPKQQLDASVSSLRNAINSKVSASGGHFHTAPTSSKPATSNSHLVRKGEMDTAVNRLRNEISSNKPTRQYTTLWSGTKWKHKNGYGELRFPRPLTDFDEIMVITTGDSGGTYNHAHHIVNMSDVINLHSRGYGVENSALGKIKWIGFNGNGSIYWIMPFSSDYSKTLNFGHYENSCLRAIVGITIT